MQRQVILEKAEKVRELRDMVQKYQALGIASLYKVRASQLQELRKKLEGVAQVRVIKNAVVERAVSGFEGKPNIDRLMEHLKGPNLLVFTNLNPFTLALLLEKSKVKAFAKAGDVATEDVVVPGGNTGLSPGPIISQLGSVGIPTRIESGSVWVNRDTVVVRKGEVISESLAPILSKLGMRAMEMGLSLKAVYDAGAIIPEEELKLDLDGYRQNVAEAYIEAFRLSLNAMFPMVDNISTLVKIAYKEAYNLAINASLPSPDIIGDLLKKAYLKAVALSSKISA